MKGAATVPWLRRQLYNYATPSSKPNWVHRTYGLGVFQMLIEAIFVIQFWKDTQKEVGVGPNWKRYQNIKQYLDHYCNNCLRL